MSRHIRRSFLQHSAAATAGVATAFTVAGTKASGKVLDANDTVNVGVAGIHVKKATYTLGPLLEFDPEKEKFVGNRDADKLLTREYLAPFVVPEQV